MMLAIAACLIIAIKVIASIYAFPLHVVGDPAGVKEARSAL
jgi:hypothetical protein